MSKMNDDAMYVKTRLYNSLGYSFMEYAEEFGMPSALLVIRGIMRDKEEALLCVSADMKSTDLAEQLAKVTTATANEAQKYHLAAACIEAAAHLIGL